MELNAWTASANQPTTAPRADQLNVNVIAVHSHYMLLDGESYTVHPVTPAITRRGRTQVQARRRSGSAACG